MNSGTKPTRLSHKDFDYHQTFGTVVPPSFPDEYLTDAGLDMPDQNAEGLPFGCTDVTQAELCIDETLEVVSPLILEAITHANALGGFDIRSSLDAAMKLGWFGAYFNIRHPQLDAFDSIRLAILSGAPEKRSVSIGTPWYTIFHQVGTDGVIQAPNTYDPTGLPWHNYKICGWKQINGQPMLIGKSWQGVSYGDRGFHYISRPILNSMMTVSGTVAFTATQVTPPNIQTVDLSYLQWLLSYLRTLVGISY